MVNILFHAANTEEPIMVDARDETAASGGVTAGKTATAKPPPPSNPTRNTGALGLPSGSIRAILTLMTVAFITIQTARGERVSLLWFESLMIVLAHYFASRRLVQLSPELRTRLTKEGVLEAEPNPLYLPRYSLRLLIVGAFAALAALPLAKWAAARSRGPADLYRRRFLFSRYRLPFRVRALAPVQGNRESPGRLAFRRHQGGGHARHHGSRHRVASVRLAGVCATCRQVGSVAAGADVVLFWLTVRSARTNASLLKRSGRR